MDGPEFLGRCRACEWVQQFDDEEFDLDEEGWVCKICGDDLIPYDELGQGEIAVARLHLWLREVREKELGGPSPGGAAAELRCSRSMIDKLVGMRLLERVDYDADGHRIVMISDRSIQRVKEAKKKEGKWTDAEPS